MAQGDIARVKGFKVSKDKDKDEQSQIQSSKIKSKKTNGTKITTIHDMIEDSQEDNLDNDYLMSLNDQIKLGEMILRIEKRKKVGIQPDNLKNNDVRMSFQYKTTLSKSSAQDEDKDELFPSGDWTQWVIIRRQGKFWSVWKFIYTIACMASSYVYAFFAAFDSNGIHGQVKSGLQPHTTEYNINLFFMVFFFSTLSMNFLVDFQR